MSLNKKNTGISGRFLMWSAIAIAVSLLVVSCGDGGGGGGDDDPTTTVSAAVANGTIS